jgi:hypothetical protein
MRFLVALVGCAILACALFAQGSTGPSLESDGSTRVSVNIHGISISPVTGKPFSGSDSIDWMRILEDGSVVATLQDAKLARDGQGRIYRENVTRFPANTSQKSRVKEIIIFDPVAHTRTECVMAAGHCNVTDYRAPTSLAPQPVAALDNGTRGLSRENLGTDTIDGLNVVGTRETLTIKAGTAGNNQPISTTEGYWYSPELGVTLSVTRKDPRTGTLVIHVVDLSRSEPDPSLFQVPENFVVEDHRRPAKTEN